MPRDKPHIFKSTKYLGLRIQCGSVYRNWSLSTPVDPTKPSPMHRYWQYLFCQAFPYRASKKQISPHSKKFSVLRWSAVKLGCISCLFSHIAKDILRYIRRRFRWFYHLSWLWLFPLPQKGSVSLLPSPTTPATLSWFPLVDKQVHFNHRTRSFSASSVSLCLEMYICLFHLKMWCTLHAINISPERPFLATFSNFGFLNNTPFPWDIYLFNVQAIIDASLTMALPVFIGHSTFHMEILIKANA